MLGLYTARCSSLLVARRTHGLTFVAEYQAWRQMVLRCTSPKHQHYPQYGGAGITVCSEWVESYERFRRDLGPCPEGKQLGRLDMRKGYSRANTRWVTRSEAMRASNVARKLEYRGEIRSIVEWSERTGVPAETLRRRLRARWAVGQALGYEKRET